MRENKYIFYNYFSIKFILFIMVVILSVEYDGTNYSGWQKQINAETIQQQIENAISCIYGEEINTVGAGRTDAGVHAAAQIVNFNIDKLIINNTDKMAIALNSLLPNDIFVNNVWFTNLNFNARRDAIAREYIYKFCTKQTVFNRYYSAYYPYKFDKNLLFDVANIFEGKNDFTTFSKQNTAIKNYVCDVNLCKWRQTDEYNFELIIKSNRFVYGMVRSIIGAMFDVIRGKRSIKDVENSLKQKDRSLNSTLAPACGLILNRIYYSIIKYPFFY